MSPKAAPGLLLDEHYSAKIAVQLRLAGFDVEAVVENPDLRGHSDDEVFSYATFANRYVVTENVADFMPLLTNAMAANADFARLLLVAARRFPRTKDISAIVTGLIDWLGTSQHAAPVEWL